MRMVLLAGAATILAAGSASAAVLRYSAVLKGGNETPPVAGAGHGEMKGVLYTDRGLFDYTTTFSGLSGKPVAAAFHGQGATADDATTLGPATTAHGVHGELKLDAAQVNDLNAGRWTFDITTSAHPGGEIGGRVERTSED